MRTGRIEAFSDGVFAIAITLLVLEIHVPEDLDGLPRQLLRLWPSFLGFVISFLLIGLIWANHHAMFEQIERGDHSLLFLNTLLLMDISFLPFVTALLAGSLRDGRSEVERVAVVFYGATLVVGGVFFDAVWWIAVRHGLLAGSLSDEDVQGVGRRFAVGPVSYLIGTGLGWFVPLLGLVVFAGLIVFYWLPGRAAQSARPAQ